MNLKNTLDDRESTAFCEQFIVEGIQSGRYRPTKRLGEASLAKELGVGQATVRSAFARLGEVGLLDRRHRSGTYVREFSVHEFVELTQIRALLEGFACRLATQCANRRELGELETLARSLDRKIAKLTPETFREVEEQDFAFHQKLVGMSQSAPLIKLLGDQHLILSCLRYGFDLPGVFAGSDSESPSHVELVKAISTGDPNEADTCVRRHLICCLKAELRLDAMIEL